MRRIIILSFLASFLCVSCLIQNPKKEDCEVKEITVSKVYEGSDKDIFFAEDNGEFYYINRGLEQGYTIEGVRKKVLHKNITLHLANTLIGLSLIHI